VLLTPEGARRTWRRNAGATGRRGRGQAKRGRVVVRHSQLLPRHTRCVAAPRVLGIVASAGLRVLVEEPVKELDVAAGQAQGLDLGELVTGQGGYDVAEGGEGFVEGLGALALAHIGHDPLLLQVVVGESEAGG